jgi:hypothetical protein
MLSASTSLKFIGLRCSQLNKLRLSRWTLFAFFFSLSLILWAFAQSGVLAQSTAIRGEVSINTTGGYGRLVIHLAQPVDAEVRMSSGILIVQFRQPVDVPVNRVAAGASQYLGAARRDPDGRALRFALAQKLKVSTTVAGERLFIDLLPESWTGDLPGLPREIVEELSRRAQDAERQARQKIQQDVQQSRPPVRVRVASQPTFSRFVFDLPDMTPVSSERSKDRLTLNFATPFRFDLSEVKLALPPAVEAVDASIEGDGSTVKFIFSQPADIRSFREDHNYVVDVAPVSVSKSSNAVAMAGVPGGPLAATTAPDKAPAREQAAPATAAEISVSKPDIRDGETAPKPEPQAAIEPPPPQVTAPSGNTAPNDSAGRRAPRNPNRPVVVELRRQGDNLRLFFPFSSPTSAAMFQRADTLWLVFDTELAIEADALNEDPSNTIRGVESRREGGAHILRLKLERPRLTSVEGDREGWLVVIGDAIQSAAKPIVLARNVVVPGRASISIPFAEPRSEHWLTDPDIGDKLLVVTGFGPARGLIKSQDFIDLRAIPSAHGIVIQPWADDLRAELSVDKVLLSRPSGLILSESGQPAPARYLHAVTFDTKLWNDDRSADYVKRQFDLIRAAADAPFVQRTAHRLDLARFYFSRQMYPEAKAILDATISDERPTAADPSPLVLRAIANIMLGRFDAAIKDLNNSAVGNQNDAQLWRALVASRQSRWAEAHQTFRFVEAALSSLPLELQQIALQDAMRASIEVGDFSAASNRLNDFQIVGVSKNIEPFVTVLAGRLAESVGRVGDALSAYRSVVPSEIRPAAAQARLREIALTYSLGDLKKNDAINELEVLSTAWRGDDTEIEALQRLAKLYIEDRRYRDAFHIMRVALRAHPNAARTREIHDEAAKAFEGLFLAGNADTLPAIEALGLFYDYRDLTPVGRAGDEMIRRLAERLVAVDLLDQAAELLQYQVDNRLQGAARAQVASRLAVIYLLNNNPIKAQAVLRATRTADLANEIRIPRLLIEARALSDSGRHDFALDVIAGIEGRESLRLRSDIYWAAKRWQSAAEHIELLYGERWKQFEPLTESERIDVLRAGMAYAMADDKLGNARLREKYAAKMSDSPERRAFELVTGGLGPASPEFREVARIIASGDTLASFLWDLKVRYPEMHGLLAEPPVESPSAPPVPATTGSLGSASKPRMTMR